MVSPEYKHHIDSRIGAYAPILGLLIVSNLVGAELQLANKLGEERQTVSGQSEVVALTHGGGPLHKTHKQRHHIKPPSPADIPLLQESFPMRSSLVIPPPSPRPAADNNASVPPRGASLNRTANHLPPRHLTARPALVNTGLFSWIDNLPTLDDLKLEFPKSFKNADEQERYIRQLKSGVKLKVRDYKDLEIHRKYERAFTSQPNYYSYIDPEMFIVHWTAVDYKNGVEDFVKVMRREGLRIEFFIDDTGKIYKLFEGDHHYPAHALGANSFSQGVEIEAKNLFGYTPEQLKSAVLLAVKFCRENNLPVNRSTILGHYAVDLIYDNPTYDKYTGTFHKSNGKKPYLGKIDPPQEVINFLVKDAKKLDKQLG
jgi:hypothetical protein